MKILPPLANARANLIWRLKTFSRICSNVEKYNIRIKPSAVKEIEAIPQKKDRQKIVARIQTLADDPRPPGCRKLTE